MGSSARPYPASHTCHHSHHSNSSISSNSILRPNNNNNNSSSSSSCSTPCTDLPIHLTLSPRSTIQTKRHTSNSLLLGVPWPDVCVSVCVCVCVCVLSSVCFFVVRSDCDTATLESI